MSINKKETISGLKWSAIERLSTQFLQLIFMLVMAKLVGPNAFGLIGMLFIFVSIGQVLIDSGMSSALIRKTNLAREDFNTAFYFNITIALIIYSTLFFISEWVADFYRQPELKNLVKYVCLILLFNSFSLVPRTILTINMNFKAQAKASLIALVTSGLIGFYLAYKGYGVWALATQLVATSFITAIMFMLTIKWRPGKRVSKSSFMYLFNFGSKLLVAGILDAAYNNIYPLIIGKKIDAFSVGQYTQANQIATVPAMAFTNVIQRVSFPILSKLQNQNLNIDSYYLIIIRLASIIIFPLMIGLSIVAQPLSKIVLGNAWDQASELIPILSLALMLYPIHAVNLNILQVKGRSDLFLKAEFYKKIVGLTMLFMTYPHGIYIMCYGVLIHSYMSLTINIYFVSKVSENKFFKQIKVLLPALINSVSVCLCTLLFVSYLNVGAITQVILLITISIIMYISVLLLTQKKWAYMILTTVNKSDRK
ncbi:MULTISPECIES: lipopolysaccharide biosynthesis protein [Pantoea]|uniref:lipopolysaccharide biosynthesis protein n=1 Tax=Pantoea TaxID=53335 RepID=UPI0008FD6CB8|nr:MULTISPECIES: lipopolysaccharide biosynthesis protein [unclassified Pantoea]OIX99043.1 lipopolysaccharide biosynthesis protein [Pantoea sp. Ae16]